MNQLRFHTDANNPMIGPRLLIIFLTSLLAGCTGARDLSPDQLINIIDKEQSRFVGRQASTVPPSNLKQPIAPAIGLYLKPTGFLHRGFEWTDQDRETLLAWAKTVQPNPAARKHGFVSQSSLKDDTLHELTASAARYDYDLLLVVDGAATVHRYNNYKALLLYWTILGAYFADGTHSDALCLVKGSLWDVKSGALILSEVAEGQIQAVGPAALLEDETVVLHARQKALASILDPIGQKLRSTVPHSPITPQ
ncbi:hypothetical protein [Petrachloros mirabilis]